MIYRLNATIITKLDDLIEESNFDRLLNVKLIKKTGQNETSYDPELKIHYNNQSALSCVYEIETSNVQMEFPRRLKKASEIIRKTNYRYDWIQARVNTRGKVLSIENKDELKDKWQKIRSIILKSYEGTVLDNYLEKIDEEFETKNKLYDCINQYFFFGLLFLGIPSKNTNSWIKTRIIQLSEYDSDCFEEQITYIETKGNLRYFSISGKSLTETDSLIHQYEGTIEIPSNELLPSNVTVTVSFKEKDVEKTWTFNLTQF